MTSRHPPSPSAWLLGLALLSAPAAAQEQLDVYAGLAAGDGLAVFSEVGDLNADGVVEHLAGAPDADDQRGSATLFDGATGAVLYTFRGDTVGERFGHAVGAAGDLDGDGVPDLIVGAPGVAGSDSAGRVALLSGADFSELDVLLGTEPGSGFGFAVSALADVDGDGVGEILVGAPFQGADRGRAAIHSGADGSLLGARDGAADGDTYGFSVDGSLAFGDGSPEPIIGKSLGMDGSPEPIIGAPQLGNAGPGYVEILSLPDLLPLSVQTGSGPGARFGRVVAWVGDVDGDGLLDHLVSSLPLGVGRVQVFSAGAVLHEFQGESPDTGFGESAAGIGDIDGDGHDDIAVGEPRSDGAAHVGSQSGSVWIFDGHSGGLAHLIHGAPGAHLGAQLGYAGDVDLDGQADTGLGAPGADTNGPDAGMVVVLAFGRFTWLDGGQAAFQGAPKLAADSGGSADDGDVQGDDQQVLTVGGVDPGADLTLVIGQSLVVDALGQSLSAVPAGVHAGLQADAQGTLSLALDLPPGLLGQSLVYFQVLTPTPDGPLRSNALAASDD